MPLFADDATDHHTSKNIQNISSKLQIKATSPRLTSGVKLTE